MVPSFVPMAILRPFLDVEHHFARPTKSGGAPKIFLGSPESSTSCHSQHHSAPDFSSGMLPPIASISRHRRLSVAADFRKRTHTAVLNF